MTLEEQITRGRVTYIHALGHDAHRAQLVILFLDALDLTTIARTLIFRGLRGYRDDWDDPEPVGDHDVESVIGIDEYPEGESTRYLIRTDSREISFESALPPEIIEHAAP